jgi:hypothetical protein
MARELSDAFSSSGGGDPAVKVAVYATLMYDIISATNSSPQTTEINANKRANTLMKWVHLGIVQGLLFVAIGVYLDKDRWPPLMGGGLAAVILYAQYRYALQSGLDYPGETTEAVN